MILIGGLWFFFFLRVNVMYDGDSSFHLGQADLFVGSLIVSVAFALIWHYMQTTAAYTTSTWIVFGIYIFFTTLLRSVPWSKFAHMFVKPAVAFQRRGEEASGCSDLPSPSTETTLPGTDRYAYYTDMTKCDGCGECVEVVWAAQNIDSKETPSELITSEPYVMGSHATCSGAWASGPEDCAPAEYQWGYNRMTTVEGLFGAGDTIGGSAHKFSAGSFVEGRLAAKAAVRYVIGRKTESPQIDDDEVERLKREARRQRVALLTGSQYDPKSKEWTMSKLPVHRIVEGFELLRI